METRPPLCAGCIPAGRCQFGVTSCRLDADGVARARVWVERTRRHFERHAEWLREQDAIAGP